MRGKVLQYDDRSATGMISGDDGKRYTFTRGDLQGSLRSVAPGMEVDFEANGATAGAIFLDAAIGGASKSRVAAILLAAFLGGIGIHKFYLGRAGAGIIMLLFCWTFIPAIIAFVEFIIYAVKSDAQFHQDYVVEKRGWF